MPKFIRRVIKITALDSPAVRRELARQRGDPQETWPDEIPGVLTYQEYQHRLSLWDEVRACIGLRAEFYLGAELLLFPPDWLDNSARLAERLRGRPRRAEAIGCDPGEGGASSAWSVVDRQGLLCLPSLKTPDTSVIPSRTIALLREHGVPPECVGFDRGGGGKQHADTLRAMGYPVRTIAFGEAVTPEPRRGMAKLEERVGQREDRYTYLNMRSAMYGEFSLLLDPANPECFAIPAEFTELRRQLAIMPKLYDREGRLRMLPKNKTNPNSNEKTLVEILGASPDEADSLVTAVWIMRHKTTRASAGAIR